MVIPPFSRKDEAIRGDVGVAFRREPAVERRNSCVSEESVFY